MKTHFTMEGDIRQSSKKVQTLRIDTIDHGDRWKSYRPSDWISRFRESYISIETGGNKKTNGEIEESVSRFGASPSWFAIWNNEGLLHANRTYSLIHANFEDCMSNSYMGQVVGGVPEGEAASHIRIKCSV